MYPSSKGSAGKRPWESAREGRGRCGNQRMSSLFMATGRRLAPSQGRFPCSVAGMALLIGVGKVLLIDVMVQCYPGPSLGRPGQHHRNC